MQPDSSADTRGPSRSKLVRTLLPVFLYFLAAGIATVMLGPILPTLIQHWHIQDAQAGTLFTASFAGQFCGAWFATRNLRASVLFGSAITAAGCAAMAWAGFGSAHIALFGVGLGLGAGLTAGNVIAGTVVPAARARLIAILNVVWGLGAITCPLLVRILSVSGIQRFFFAAATFLAIASLVSFAIPQAQPAKSEFDASPPKASPLPLPVRLLIAFAAALFLYVGVENSLGGWLPSYAIRTNPLLRASSISLYFWVAELSGRLLVTFLIVQFGEAMLYRVCLALLILTQILLCVAVHISAAGVVTLTILAALSLAPLYPLILSFLLARTGRHPKLGSLFATASFGGATLPWLTGVFSTSFNGLRAGLFVPAAGAILLLFLSTILPAKPHLSSLKEK
ncbi:MAG TPA: MFS transporter [Edaphobacter sp.]|nr:MFS transporter [Edaphobacter sp.]